MLLTARYSNAVAVTPSDTADLPSGTCDGLFITGAGNVKFGLVGGGTITKAVIASEVVKDFRIRRVYATLTTATGILALT